MDAGFSADDEVINEDPDSICTSKVPDESSSCGTVKQEAAVVVVQSQFSKLPVSPTPCMGPETPDPDREIGVQNRDLPSSPLTLAPSPPSVPCLNASRSIGQTTCLNGDSSVTPKNSIFDSFAPGPEKLMLAPHHQRYTRESCIHVVRQLDFGYTTNLASDFDCETNEETVSDEEHMFEHIYSAVLDDIFSEQIKELVPQSPSQDSDSDGIRTPKPVPTLSGVADACPGAPRKSAARFRYIDREICRKLEF